MHDFRLCRHVQNLTLGLLLILPALAGAQSIDTERLDEIGVRMPRGEARQLLGPPNAEQPMAPGLIAELYRLDEPGPLIANGLLYDDAGRLAGQTLVLEGPVGEPFSELLLERGYRSAVDEATGQQRLIGRDDDSGLPQLVTITEDGDYTIVTIFDAGFLKKHGR